jgi:hypothetical protein
VSEKRETNKLVDKWTKLTHTHTHTLKNVGDKKRTYSLLWAQTLNSQNGKKAEQEWQNNRRHAEGEWCCRSCDLSEILGFICQHNDNKIIRFSSCRHQQQQQQQILFYYKSNKILV